MDSIAAREQQTMTRKSDMQPFESGDILIGCTLLNDPDDDHAGDGRIRQYDKDMQLKGELWTEGGRHYVGGLEFDRNGLLWAFNDHAIIHVDPKTGRQLPLAEFRPRCFYSASFAEDGSIYLGEHENAEEPPPDVGKYTTIKFVRTPDTGVLGYGNIYKFNADWQFEKEFEVENEPEFLGFKGVTHSTLHPSGQFMTYTTETGQRVMRYDVVNDRQMPDLIAYTGDTYSAGDVSAKDRSASSTIVIAVRYLPDGHLLVTHQSSMDMVNEEGQVIKEYPLGGAGWSSIALCHDDTHVLVSNIWQGNFIKLHLESGEVVNNVDTGFKAPRRCLAGIAVYPGDHQ
jgi:hypothetical protein